MEPIARIKTETPSPYELAAILEETHDTKTFRFSLPDGASLDMLSGDFLFVHATVDGKSAKRPYTPSSLPDTVGSFDLTVKRYETGTVSKYLHERKVGDRVLMSGPRTGGHWSDGMATRVGFVAGGTGITPMVSIIRWILAKGLDAKLFLIYSNKTERDIIFREEWDRAVRDHPNLHCFHVLEEPPPGWSQGTGRITDDVLRAHLPAPGPETKVFLCGPPPMVGALKAALRGLGYAERDIILP
jgi:cytochrome-b5 reductase